MASKTDERNALTELADELDYHHFPHTMSPFQDRCLHKAQRIIAELAKVKCVYNIYGVRLALDYESTRAVMRCREIAEEGAKE